MTATYATETAMPKNFERWAGDQVVARRLTRGQAQVLEQLAAHVDRRGVCFPSVKRLAQRTVISERTVYRALNELEQLGLVQSTRRGQSSARRRLCPEAPMPAPACPRGTPPMFDSDLQPVACAAAADLTSAPSDLPSGVRGKYHLEGTAAGGDARDARPAAEQQPRVPAPLQPKLVEVLEVLDAAPGLVVEPLAVNSALASYPEASGHDHLQAAHVVASYAHEGGLRCPGANRLLMAELRKQTRGRGAKPKRWHDGRRRAAAPAPVVEATFERAGESLRAWMREAGFGHDA